MSEENTEKNSTKQENERQYKLVDQLLSMHSSLRDKYKRHAFWLNTAQITISMVLCVFAFVGDDLLSSLGYHSPMARFVLGFSAVIALMLSITEFRVDWKAIGSRHVNAVGHLSALKAKYRKAFNESAGNDSKKDSRLMTEYQKIMAILPPIPERYFLQLKADHQFKRVLSQRIGQNPKAPVWVLRIRLRLEGMRAALKKGETNRADEGREISDD